MAPLSGELLSHDLDRTNDELRYELAVESYQMPFDEVALVDEGREVSSERLTTDELGRYSGKLSMKGEGLFASVSYRLETRNAPPRWPFPAVEPASATRLS